MILSSAPEHRDPAAWLWPQAASRLTARGRRPGLRGALRSASFVEWRYYAVLAEAFHGIVGMALVNPEDRFGAMAESGLLLIVAGVLDRPALPDAAAAAASPLPTPPPAALCWMHLFPAAACGFDEPAPGALRAGDATCCIALTHHGPGAAEMEIEAGAGLRLRLSLTGLAGAALTPTSGQDFPGPLGSAWLGAHWTVDCPSPVAVADGSLTLDSRLLAPLAAGPGRTPGYATPALRERVADGEKHWSWQGAAGYYEHSWGVRPLPLHGWDFLFVPDAQAGQSVVLQTYRGSRALRYLDLCWRDGDGLRTQRFGADALRLTWADSVADPVLGVRRPLVRRIEATADGWRLVLTNRVLHRLPLLRPEKPAVRHFFISEEVGIADWTLTDARGEVQAATQGQPCGGELAHFRLRAPRVR